MRILEDQHTPDQMHPILQFYFPHFHGTSFLPSPNFSFISFLNLLLHFSCAISLGLHWLCHRDLFFPVRPWDLVTTQLHKPRPPPRTAWRAPSTSAATRHRPPRPCRTAASRIRDELVIQLTSTSMGVKPKTWCFLKMLMHSKVVGEKGWSEHVSTLLLSTIWVDNALHLEENLW